MEIKIAPNKLNKEESKLHVDENQHVYTLIGENGCGKSSILETIFKDHENISGNGFIVAYSSGKNERFSKLYKKGIQVIKKNELDFIENKENTDDVSVYNNNLKWFYFDKTWAQILIFLATMLKRNGKVRKFLNDKEYIKVNNDQDITSSLVFRIHISSKIRKFVRKLREKAELDVSINESSQRTSYLMLENIVNYVDFYYDFDRKFTCMMKVNNKNFYNLLKKDVIQNIDFFYQYGVTKNAISISTISLKFKNGISLEDLSDGEFQILTVYAILDLFDSENTIFLFDEIDSHLYYKRINELWESLYQIKGIVITTTHIPDSILGNKIDSLCLVEKGNINGDATMQEVINRMNSLTDHSEYEKQLASKCKYIALVEDQTDWYIFTELLKKLIGKDKVEDFKNKVVSIKCSSGYATPNEELGNSKKNWINDLKKVIKPGKQETKQIFGICDRDDFPVGAISKKDGVRPEGIKNIEFKGCETHILSWKRKQIENYLLSHTMLKKIKKLNSINEELAEKYQLRKGDKSDNKVIQELEIKDKIKSLYSGEGTGVDYTKLQEIIDDIPKNEVSDDIMNMYNFINSKLDKCDQQ